MCLIIIPLVEIHSFHLHLQAVGDSGITLSFSEIFLNNWNKEITLVSPHRVSTPLHVYNLIDAKTNGLCNTKLWHSSNAWVRFTQHLLWCLSSFNPKHLSHYLTSTIRSKIISINIILNHSHCSQVNMLSCIWWILWSIQVSVKFLVSEKPSILDVKSIHWEYKILGGSFFIFIRFLQWWNYARLVVWLVFYHPMEVPLPCFSVTLYFWFT